jgi:hypothetical protein
LCCGGDVRGGLQLYRRVPRAACAPEVIENRIGAARR